MRIRVLRLQNFRNYAEAEFTPVPGITLVTGRNGSGKSTLLEAVQVFATLGSPRAAHFSQLVRFDCDEAGARLEQEEGTLLEIRIRGGRSVLRAGGSGTVARSFLGRFRAVLFTPEDLDLVRGEPELRRRALDELIVQLRPAYRGVRSDYDRALRQRNAALRHQNAAGAAVYDAPLAAAAAQVLDARREMVRGLGPHASELYEALAGLGTLAIRYVDTSRDEGLTGEALEEHLRRRYAESLEIDLERGSTRVGPHRDDLEILVDGVSARTFASRGEQRSAALALRLGQLRLLPGAVLLLDDVLSELDADRSERVFDVAGASQIVVTATEPEDVPKSADVQALWTVERGVLRERGAP